MATFFTADWHLGDPRVELLGRPFADADEMNEHIIREHNKLVAPDDTVYVVGDALSATSSADVSILERFNGTLHLIRGNHDVLTDEEYAPYFETITAEGDGVELEVGGMRLYLTHYPTQAKTGYDLNLTGHVHGAIRSSRGCLNVGVDCHWARPVLSHDPDDPKKPNTVAFYLAATKTFYDDDVWTENHPVNLEHADRGKSGSYFATRQASGDAK